MLGVRWADVEKADADAPITPRRPGDQHIQRIGVVLSRARAFDPARRRLALSPAPPPAWTQAPQLLCKGRPPEVRPSRTSPEHGARSSESEGTPRRPRAEFGRIGSGLGIPPSLQAKLLRMRVVACRRPQHRACSFGFPIRLCAGQLRRSPIDLSHLGRLEPRGRVQSPFVIVHLALTHARDGNSAAGSAHTAPSPLRRCGMS